MAFFLWLVLQEGPLSSRSRTRCEELNTANAGLEQRVAERTAEWMRANTELKNEIAEREAAERELIIKDRAIATSVNGIVFTDLGRESYLRQQIPAFPCGDYRERGEMIGRSALEFWQSREAGRKAIFEKAAERQGVWSGELVASEQDGSRFRCPGVRRTSSRTGSGHPLCIMAAIVDITERKQAEQRLRESEAKFKSFSEQAIVGIYLMQDGRIKYTQSLVHRDVRIRPPANAR